MQQNEGDIIGVLGATGYVGGRLVPHLLDQGLRVRAMSRSEPKLLCRPWAGREGCQVRAVDVMDQAALTEVLRGCKAVYYLIHSMDHAHADFSEADRIAARNMVRAAADAGVSRIIYLSGLVPVGPGISTHLKSRAEVADILHAGPVPATVLRAAVILGSGSASFELIRYLVDRLPVMLTPKWVRTESQPISIRNVLVYLSGCLEHDETMGQTYDIGGPHIETYERLFRIYAEEAGLKRRLIMPMPLLSPWLSSHWLGLVTPIPTALAKPLVLGLKNRVVCRDFRIREIMPQELIDCRTAIRRALDKVRQHVVDTSWADAGQLRPPEWAVCGDADYAGGTIYSTAYRIRLDGCPAALWDQVISIGGESGWYHGNALWSLRGWMDKLVGGVGLRRGRRHPHRLQIGDALDFWRVLDVVPPERLLLLAEMKLPGEAMLEFSMEQMGLEHTQLTMTATFLPRGVGGILYWYAVSPFHAWIFKGMVGHIARRTRCHVLDGPTEVTAKAMRCSYAPGPENQDGTPDDAPDNAPGDTLDDTPRETPPA